MIASYSLEEKLDVMPVTSWSQGAGTCLLLLTVAGACFLRLCISSSVTAWKQLSSLSKSPATPLARSLCTGRCPLHNYIIYPLLPFHGQIFFAPFYRGELEKTETRHYGFLELWLSRVLPTILWKFDIIKEYKTLIFALCLVMVWIMSTQILRCWTPIYWNVTWFGNRVNGDEFI